MAAVASNLILLHGFTHTGASWDPVVKALGERYLPVQPDIRGHGSASDRLPVTLDAVLDDLESAVAPAGSLTLAGYSMGGRIALHAALSPAIAPKLERLVLVSASPGLASPDERAARVRQDERLAAEVEASTIDQFAARWAQTPVLAGQPPEVQRAAHADRLRSTPAGLAAALRGLGTGVLPSLWGRLGEVSVPVTLVVGERDAKFRGMAEEMRLALPNAAVTVVQGAGHAVHLEAPAQVAAAIADRG